MNVILIGYMGCGKTTLGKKIAQRLNFQFIDTDKLIEQQQNQSIQSIFEEKGEHYFRTLELELIESLKNTDKTVISTGGGMPCYNNQIKPLQDLGLTIYLKRPAKELAHRIFHSKKERPLTAGKTYDELVHYIEQNVALREPYYSQATLTIDRSIESIDALELIVKAHLSKSTS